jgi:hypothetical protein
MGIGLSVVVVAVAVVAVAGVSFFVTRPSKKAGPVNTNTRPLPPAATAPGASTPNTTTPQQATTAAILADYRTAESILGEDAAAYPANALDPRLPQHMTGPELRTVQNFLTVLRIQGHHGDGTADLSPRVDAINGTTATITDCVFDHGRIVDGRTGKTISGPDRTATLNTISMLLESGTWKISDNQQVGTGCVQSA